jgi:hypothetical protein
MRDQGEIMNKEVLNRLTPPLSRACIWSFEEGLTVQKKFPGTIAIGRQRDQWERPAESSRGAKA